MSFVLGLTGGIGMGKSTASKMFAARGVPVWDADGAVHALYQPGGPAVARIEAAFPGTTGPEGVDRASLRAALADDPAAFARLNSIVHPLVAADRSAFLERHRAAPLVVLDIPLLFETGADAAMDAVAVVSTDEPTRRARVLNRPGMTEEMLDLILSKQMPDREKRARADWIIPSDSLEGADAAITTICAAIAARQGHMI